MTGRSAEKSFNSSCFCAPRRGKPTLWWIDCVQGVVLGALPVVDWRKLKPPSFDCLSKHSLTVPRHFFFGVLSRLACLLQRCHAPEPLTRCCPRFLFVVGALLNLFLVLLVLSAANGCSACVCVCVCTWLYDTSVWRRCSITGRTRLPSTSGRT